jgi:hypothetical protein
MDLAPGQSTTVDYPFEMHPGMGGPHHFAVTIPTDSPQAPTITLDVIAIAG